VVNYILTLRRGLFRLAAAAGIESPVHFAPSHVCHKSNVGEVMTLDDIMDQVKIRVEDAINRYNKRKTG
jgi:glutamate synthase (ferredoxin)